MLRVFQVDYVVRTRIVCSNLCHFLILRVMFLTITVYDEILIGGARCVLVNESIGRIDSFH